MNVQYQELQAKYAEYEEYKMKFDQVNEELNDIQAKFDKLKREYFKNRLSIVNDE